MSRTTFTPSLIAACLFGLLSASTAQAAAIYVAPQGQANAAGDEAHPLASLAEAAGRAQPGDVIRVAGGTYRQMDPIRLVAKAAAERVIRVEPAETARPVFDFSEQEFSRNAGGGIIVDGDYWHVVGLEVFGAGRNGFLIQGHHNVIESCSTHDNQATGFDIREPGSHNLLLNCDSYRNVDRPTLGENADGFGVKYLVGEGNILRGCRAWENADDGFDLWRAPHPVRIENSVTFRNGIDLWGIPGYTGNGNGFKLGGDFIAAAHVVTGCVAMDQPQNGFDLNNNSGAVTIENCTALRCGTGFILNLCPLAGAQHVLRNNLSFGGDIRLAEGTVSTGNRWLNAEGGTVEPVILAAPGMPYVSARRPDAVPPEYRSAKDRVVFP